jgi:hypothetical protein
MEVAAFVGSVSFRKTTLTVMCYGVPAFAGIGSDHSSFPKYIKTKNE